MAKTLPSQCRGPDLILDQGTRPCSLQLRVSMCVCVCVCVCVCARSVVPSSSQPHGLYSPPGSSVHRILQARILKERKEGRKEERKKEKSLSRVWLFATPWTVAHQAPRSKGFSRQEYWTGLPFPPPGDPPHPGIEPESLCLLQGQVDSLALRRWSPAVCHRAFP